MKRFASRLLILLFAAGALSACTHGTWPLQLVGEPAQAGSGARTIAIGPDVRHVNVTGGEVINFNVEGKAFAWHFLVPVYVTHFDLKRVAPPGVLNRSVIAYVAADPRYINR